MDRGLGSSRGQNHRSSQDRRAVLGSVAELRSASRGITMKTTNGHRSGKSGVKKFEQNWYALALSSELEAGKLISRDFLDSKVVIYRGENGVASVLTPYCSHLGADLSIGCVVGNDLRCAFHHWQYGQDGVCTKIPVSDKIPSKARLFKYPTTEKWGLVWAFNGVEPLYDVP